MRIIGIVVLAFGIAALTGCGDCKVKIREDQPINNVGTAPETTGQNAEELDEYGRPKLKKDNQQKQRRHLFPRLHRKD